MFKAKKAKKLFMKAYGNMPEGERQEIIDQYKDDSKKRGLSVSDSVNIANEEVAAAYAEEIFNSPDVWEFVLSEEPSLKDRVLKFFRGANKKYSFEPGMTKAAKKWLSEYKKLFNEVAAYNKGRSAAENATPSDTVRKIEKLGKLENGKITLFGTNKEDENTLLRMLNAENAQKSTLTNTKQKNMHVSDSGERASLSNTKVQKLKETLQLLGEKKIKLKAGEKLLTIRTDEFTENKNIFSDKGRKKSEVNARIKAIPDFEKILRNSSYDSSDTQIRGIEKDAKKGL